MEYVQKERKRNNNDLSVHWWKKHKCYDEFKGNILCERLMMMTLYTAKDTTEHEHVTAFTSQSVISCWLGGIWMEINGGFHLFIARHTIHKQEWFTQFSSFSSWPSNSSSLEKREDSDNHLFFILTLAIFSVRCEYTCDFVGYFVHCYDLRHSYSY